MGDARCDIPSIVCGGRVAVTSQARVMMYRPIPCLDRVHLMILNSCLCTCPFFFFPFNTVLFMKRTLICAGWK